MNNNGPMNMLQKYEEIPIDQENPWADDQLDHKKSAEILGRVLKSIEQPFVISINSPFGTGKSYFVNRLVQQFRNEDQIAVYFNAWEKDNQGQPLLSFVGELQTQLSEVNGAQKIPETMKTLARRAGDLMLKRVLPIAVRIATAGLIGDNDAKSLVDIDKDLAAGAGDLAEGLVQQQLESEKASNCFRTDLKRAVKDALGKNKTPNSTSSIYVFVDELDRCRPPYALELLENIKHLFSVPGLVFILSVDREHLKNSISTIYGAGMDSEGYLARFIDQNYYLPKPDHSAYANFLFKRFGLETVMRDRREGYQEGGQIVQHFSEFAELFDLSLRNQEQAFVEINFILRNTPPDRAIFAPLLGQLAALKRYDHKIYSDYCEGRMPWTELHQKLLNEPKGQEWLNDEGSRFAKAWLMIGNINDNQQIEAKVGDIIAKLDDIESSDSPSPESQDERKRLETEHDLFLKAFRISDELRNRYGAFDGHGATPAGILFEQFNLAVEFQSA